MQMALPIFITDLQIVSFLPVMRQSSGNGPFLSSPWPSVDRSLRPVPPRLTFLGLALLLLTVFTNVI